MYVCHQDTARRIARISKEAKLEVDEDTYVDSFKPFLMDVVNSWCNGSSFAQICQMTDVFEGEGGLGLWCLISALRLFEF